MGQEGIAQLKQFEAVFDQRVDELTLWKWPVRSILSAMFGCLDALCNGRRLVGGVGRRPEDGGALASRFSYIVPKLLKCPTQPFGSDALDAMPPINSDPALAEEFKTLLEYIHFSEIMPEVHRGYFDVSGNLNIGFVLNHQSQDVSDLEARDVIMTDLAMPTYLQPPFPQSFIDFYLKQFDSITAFLLLYKARYSQISNSFKEYQILTDEGYLAATGGSYKQFYNFRSAWFAIAETCLALADYFGEKARTAKGLEAEKYGKEFLEWITVNMKSTFLFGIVDAVTGIPSKIIDNFFNLFSVSPLAPSCHPSKDGYFPPFWVIQSDSVIFNPNAVLFMMSPRNIPFAINQIEPDKFNNIVSKHLEPALVQEMIDVLPSSGVLIRSGVDWSGGEADLFVYEPETNTVIHVQAKGAIPAQGARMVQSIESRTREAQDQLQRFRRLQGQKRDVILSNAFGRKVEGAIIIDVILVRAGIGSAKIWQNIGDTIPVNVPLLQVALAKSAKQGNQILSAAIKMVPSILDDIVNKTYKGWETTEIKFNETVFRIPLLQLNYQTLNELRSNVVNIKSVGPDKSSH